MTLSNTDAVRLQTADRSTLTRKVFTANGQDDRFVLEHHPLVSSPAPVVTLGGVAQVENTHYTVDYANGVIDFVAVPGVNVEIVILYSWSIFSDAEIQYFLSISSDSTNLASARLLLAMAADSAKIAKKQILSGGGGSGYNSIDTSVAARELRAAAKAYVDIFNETEGTSFPAEGLTEVPWTEFTKEEAMIQDWIREN